MGVCMPIKSHSKSIISPTTCSLSSTTLQELRENAIINILRLHKQILINEKSLQEHLIQNNDVPALILKYRGIVAKTAIESLRELVSLTDPLTYGDLSKKEKAEILTQGNLILSDVNSGMLSEGFQHFLDEGKDFKKVMKELALDNRGVKELEDSLEIEKQKLTKADSEGYVRLKYVRKMREE